ncbi:MAG: dephospho-CoA kinase [Saprospiraceae bacterium]
MLKVGITGGIGSGKTTVCHLFELLGVPIYNADERAKYLMIENDMLKNQIVGAFGDSAYDGEGQLNRSYISGLVFNDKSKLELLKSFVHPAVALDFEDWATAHKHEKYVIKEAALLIEAKSYLQLDKLILVTAPEEIRLLRVTQRDGLTSESIKTRMRNQLTEEEKLRYADYVINNDSQHLLIPQVLAIHDELRSIS